MIVIMRAGAPQADVDRVLAVLGRHGAKPAVFYGEERIVIAGPEVGLGAEPLESLELLPGVERVTPLMGAYQLASREFRPQSTVVEVAGVKVGGPQFAVIAGPGAFGTPDEFQAAAHAVASSGACMLRAATSERGASPFAFLGLGAGDLALLEAGRRATALPIVAEVLEPHEVAHVARTADVVQVGARNMQNYPLLREVGRAGRPAMVTRGLSATVEEWLIAADYVMHEGNPNVILCERGIRTFEPDRQSTLDLSAIPIVKRLSHLPVVVDASHGVGHRYLVQPLALAAAAAGADGLAVEVQIAGEDAPPDSPQSLTVDGFGALMLALDRVLTAIRRPLARPAAVPPPQ
jgi:3-deoxy-7-phosphoheptulonate synthase